MMRSIRTNLLVSACLVGVAAAAPGSAIAKDKSTSASTAEDANVDTIVVTGRKSVDTPDETIKRNADGVVDSVSASDIEKTADENLSEAMDRIVGVSSNTFYGTSDAGYVSIRGFDSRYNSIDVDGNPIWFSSQNNRGAQIGQIPSAVINEVSVYKTPTADMDGNSVGGHISMRTLRAFDGGTQPYFKAGYRIGLSENESRVSDGPSDQAYAAGKFTFGHDHQFGLVFGFNRQRTATYDDFGSVLAYSQVTGPDGVIHDQVAGNTFTQSAFDKTIRNTAAFAKLEARVEDKLYAFVSGTLFDERRLMYLQRSGLFINNGGSRGVQQTGDGAADFTYGQAQVREYDYDMLRRAKVLGTGLDYRWADKGSVSLRANYTDYSNDILTRNLGSGFRLEGFDGTYDLNGSTPLIIVSDPARYEDAANWKFQNTSNTSSSAAYNRTQTLYDKVYTAGVTVHFNDQLRARGVGVTVGASWVRLDRAFNQNYDYWALNKGVALTLDQVVPPGSTMKNNTASLNNYNAFWSFLYTNGSSRTDLSPMADYSLLEDITSAFGAFRYATGNLNLLAGLRYEHTADITDTGQLVSGVEGSLHRDHSYGNWMPNAQLTFDATSHLKVRGAFTKTIGRPDFEDFAPGITTTVNVNGVTVIKGSNGNLGPRESTNYDLSVEYYAHHAMLAIAVFHKDLKGETFDEITNIYDSSGMLSEIDTVPLNTGSAKISGIEVTAGVRRFEFLPEPLKNLNLSINYTLTKPEWNVVFTDGSTRSIEGLRNHPDRQLSLRAGYVLGPARFYVNYTARGRAFVDFGATPEADIWTRSTDQLDLQANVKFAKHFMITFDAKNITNNYIIQTTGIENSLYNSLGKGRSYWFGLRYQY